MTEHDENDPNSHHFLLTGVINLDVRIGVGAITVTAADDVDTAVVRLIAQRADSDVLARTSVQMNGRTLTIRGPKARGWSVDKLFGATTGDDIVAIDVIVPAGTAMRLASYGATTTVSGRAGSVHVATGAGETRLDHIDGDLTAHFGNGSIDVERVCGSVILRYGNGNARLGEVTGRVEMASGGGELTLGTTRGSVRVRTGSGQVTIARAQHDVEIGTGSGALALGLEPGRAARLDITTGHGRLISELDVSDVAPSGMSEPITIRARTGRGDVRLFRAVA